MGSEYAELSKELKKIEPRTSFSIGNTAGKTVNKTVLISAGIVAGIAAILFTISTPGWLEKKSGGKNFILILFLAILLGILTGAGVYYFM